MKSPQITFFATLLSVVLGFTIYPAHAQFTVNSAFTGSSTGNVSVGGSAILTSGNIDPVNNGWLRLTNDDDPFSTGYGIIDESFPSSLGVLIEFDYKAWRSNGQSGDGFCVFLFNADSTVNSLGDFGGPGGSLAYAQKHGSGVASANKRDGLNGAYLGVALDIYGEFSEPIFGKIGGPGFRPNTIAMRGGVLQNTSTLNSYLYIGGTGDSWTGSSPYQLAYSSYTSSRPSDNVFYRRIRINLKPIESGPDAGKFKATVSWKTSPTANFTQLFEKVVDQLPPAYMKLGFVGSTGQYQDNLEVRHLRVTTPGGVSIEKTVNKANAPAMDTLTYTVTVHNETPAAVSNLAFTDTLRKGDNTLLPTTDFKITSVTFHNNGNSSNTASGFPNNVTQTNFPNNYFGASINMAANSNAYFTVKGVILQMPANNNEIKNTVVLDAAPSGITDTDTTNNHASTITTIFANGVDLNLAQTTVNSCLKPDSNTFTYLVSNIGTNPKPNDMQNPVKVNITLPSGFSFLGTSGQGWSISGTGSSRTFTRTSGLNSGYAYAPITINVKRTTGTGAGSWPVNATLTYAPDTTTNNNQVSDTLYSKPAPPVVSTPVTYCQNETAVALTASGNQLLWYEALSGAGTTTAPVPQTDSADTTTYYVTQHNGSCESDKALIDVQVHPTPSGTLTTTADTLCEGEPATVIFNAQQGTEPFELDINGTIYNNINNGAAVPVAPPLSTTTYELNAVTDSHGCANP